MIAFSYWSEEDHHDIRIVPVLEDGSPAGDPIVVEPPTHEFKLAGWSTNNQIGICASEPNNFALYTVPISGGRAVQIAPEGVVQHPRWTPDGQQIYYQTATSEVAVVPAEGGVPEIVPHLSADDKPRFYPHHYGSGNVASPDGSTLVLSGTKEGTEGIHIWTLAIGGNEVKQITNCPASFEDCYPCWSPSGDSIAFLRYTEGNDTTDWQCNIFVVSADGGEPRQITADLDSVAWSVIAWSPAGESIAFRSSTGSGRSPDSKTIKTISVNGGISETVAAVRDAYVTTSLTWSPDGTKIAYDYHTKSILVVSLEDSSIAEVKTGLAGVELFYVSWSPDGERIAFAANRKGEKSFYLMENFLPSSPLEPKTPAEP
jgi:Tol biopolymer transport system component